MIKEEHTNSDNSSNFGSMSPSSASISSASAEGSATERHLAPSPDRPEATDIYSTNDYFKDTSSIAKPSIRMAKAYEAKIDELAQEV